MDPTEFAISVIVSTIIVAPLLWLSGRTIVGGDKARLTDAIWIALLGIIIGTAFGYFFNGLVGFIIQLVLWLALVKHFFDCGWLSAFAIAIFAIVIFVVVVFILGIIGLGILILAI